MLSILLIFNNFISDCFENGTSACLTCQNATTEDECREIGLVLPCGEDIEDVSNLTTYFVTHKRKSQFTYVNSIQISKLLLLLQAVCEFETHVNTETGTTKIRKLCKEKTACDNHENNVRGSTTNTLISICLETNIIDKCPALLHSFQLDK